eukprot:m.319120 g.319120  ORF g.319120 m.319120 type:complete len:271 (+) comp27584_c4_seq1:174-986(+)
MSFSHSAMGIGRKLMPIPDSDGISAEDILAGVAGVLEHFVTAADAAMTEPAPTALDGDEDSSITIRDYLYRLARAGLCSKDCFIITLVYAERILQSHPEFTISRKNVHRFILISTMLASKVLDDRNCRNVYYANTGGISIQVLNELELTLIFMLDFDMQVKKEEFALYRDSLRRDTVREEDPAPQLVSRPSMPMVKVVNGMAYPFQTWQPLVTPPHSHQMVMPVTIVPVPRYSMLQQHQSGFPGLCHAKSGHHHAMIPPGAGPVRYGWPC